ncbi:MAG: ribosome maturation factor RimM [Actinomycetota bacterium]
MAVSSDPSERLEVGRIGKAHGLRGEVVVDFTTNLIDERTAVGAVLWTNGRERVVVTARPHQDKWLVRFDGVSDRDTAETLRGQTVTAEPLEDPEAVFVHDVIGCRLVDQHGADHGEIVAVIDNPASDLLELADGRLVPLAFYNDRDGDVVTVTVPAGLLSDD